MSDAKTNSLATVKGNQTVAMVGIGSFSHYLDQRKPAIQKVAATVVNPERLTKIVLACVSRTPALKSCTVESIFRSAMQSAELGLEPGSALGESYLVPFKSTCQMIVGYRGLISLAFRSGYIKSIQAKEVYQGDTFEYEMGLDQKLRHIPSGETDPAKITHAYCVIHLKDGGIISDVMTRQEVDKIRSRSRAGTSGPWVTDYAEMAKKTVTRRALKYAPMSVEMSKALAADNAVDTGDYSGLEFEALEGEFSVEGEEETRTTGVDAVKAKLNNQEPTTDKPDFKALITAKLEELKPEASKIRAWAKKAGITSGMWENCTDDTLLEQMLVVIDDSAGQ